MQLYTYQDISRRYKISISALRSRCERININKNYKDGIRVFTKAQMVRIVKHKNPQLLDTSRKIDIIELYQLEVLRSEIALRLGISLDFVKNTIAEYNRTECVVVDSKING